ncbi:hypothetical protein AB0H48_15445 [Streptomyces globisporus]|uniref:restriction system modified-DNA reader domain-containing protein n=1 Tax=Streptomyces globisporus TaxID=1908 RepID=UPI00345F519E
MDREIQVDEEVFAQLQERAEPFVDSPNSVLRRLLGLSDDGGASAPKAKRVVRVKRGALRPLIEDGKLTEGQSLVWKRRNHGDAFHATVLADGRLELDHDGSRHGTPSAAATGVAGYPVNGWVVWETEDGTALSTLRS